MIYLKQILDNNILCSAILAWFIAQLSKTFIEAWRCKKFSVDKMWESGGMPSSHSATVCALATSALIKYSLNSFEFSVSFVLATIVMYDALGVRRETGKQSKILNILLDSDLFNISSPEVFDEKLKELVGHTPFQVLAGAILGILIGIIFR